VDKLIQNLKDLDWHIRLEATKALRDIKDRRAVEPLIAALKDENSDVRAMTAYALGEIKDLRAVEPLISALKDQQWNVREGATYALGEIKDTRAINPLISSLNDKANLIFWQDREEFIAEALGKIGTLAVESLILALKDKNADVRAKAAGALGVIKDHRTVEPLISALKDQQWNVRQRATIALGEIRDRRAVEPLIVALKDEDEDVKESAVEALNLIKEGLERPLNTALKNEDLEVVALMYAFFIEQGVSGTETALIKALNKYGSIDIAEDFLYSDNDQLKVAARHWIDIEGYKSPTNKRMDIAYHAHKTIEEFGPKWGKKTI
jgi:HEAT repeat protein